ncbi:hypothetical protein AAG570_006987 [Ranatra chinensis]|uniref:Uncharacterized protein n=1 Tax=Ranatra chinensis TaxID=642074 RepID=A0ABD0YVM2_9HEMI
MHHPLNDSHSPALPAHTSDNTALPTPNWALPSPGQDSHTEYPKFGLLPKLRICDNNNIQYDTGTNMVICETNDLNTGLLLEVWNKGMIWDRALGYHWLPLPTVHYSNESFAVWPPPFFFFFFFSPPFHPGNFHLGKQRILGLETFSNHGQVKEAVRK